MSLSASSCSWVVGLAKKFSVNIRRPGTAAPRAVVQVLLEEDDVAGVGLDGVAGQVRLLDAEHGLVRVQSLLQVWLQRLLGLPALRYGLQRPPHPEGPELVVERHPVGAG